MFLCQFSRPCAFLLLFYFPASWSLWCETDWFDFLFDNVLNFWWLLYRHRPRITLTYETTSRTYVMILGYRCALSCVCSNYYSLTSREIWPYYIVRLRVSGLRVRHSTFSRSSIPSFHQSQGRQQLALGLPRLQTLGMMKAGMAAVASLDSKGWGRANQGVWGKSPSRVQGQSLGKGLGAKPQKLRKNQQRSLPYCC